MWEVEFVSLSLSPSLAPSPPTLSHSLVYTRGGELTCVYGGQRSTSDVFLNCSPLILFPSHRSKGPSSDGQQAWHKVPLPIEPLHRLTPISSETESLTEPRLHQLPGWSVSPRFAGSLPECGEHGDLNAGPRACAPSSSATEHSPHSLVFYLMPGIGLRVICM